MTFPKPLQGRIPICQLGSQTKATQMPDADRRHGSSMPHAKLISRVEIKGDFLNGFKALPNTLAGLLLAQSWCLMQVSASVSHVGQHFKVKEMAMKGPH